MSQQSPASIQIQLLPVRRRQRLARALSRILDAPVPVALCWVALLLTPVLAATLGWLPWRPRRWALMPAAESWSSLFPWSGRDTDGAAGAGGGLSEYATT